MRPIIYIHYDIAIIRDILNLLYLVKLQLIFCTSYWTVVASLVLKCSPPHVNVIPHSDGSPLSLWCTSPWHYSTYELAGPLGSVVKKSPNTIIGRRRVYLTGVGGFTPCYFWQPSSNQQPPKGPGSCSPLCSDLTTTVPRPSQLIILEPYCFCSQIVVNDPWVSARLNRGCMGSRSDCVVDS